MTKTVLFSVLLASAAISLGACDKTREQFDFSKKAPDEFAVVRRAPLEMPPDFKTIQAPRPGAQRPQEKATDALARQAILGETAAPDEPTSTSTSTGESVLLQKTGAANASPAIRATVDRETEEIAKEQSPGIDKIKKWVGQDVEPPAKLVDPVAEVNRIKQNRAQGKPITTGKTPTIDEE